MIKVNIHGSCVTRDAFEMYGTNFKIGTYISRNSILAAAQKPLELREDEFEAEPRFYKRMVHVDFNKQVMNRLAENDPEWLVIDLIDERFELLEFLTEDGEKTYITNSSSVARTNILTESRYAKKEYNVIDTSSFSADELEVMIQQYAQEILKRFSSDHIIINESYFCAHFVSNQNEKMRRFNEERVANARKMNQKLSIMYRLLKKYLNCHLIKMIQPCYADQSHKWGLAEFHYIDAYYRHFMEEVNKIVKRYHKTAINIHGSCVSRDIFNFDKEERFRVKKYVGRVSMVSTYFPAIKYPEQDTNDTNGSWENRMLKIDAQKDLFNILSDKGDYLVIDLMDELWDLMKVSKDNTITCMTYSQVLRRSDMAEVLARGKNRRIIHTNEMPEDLLEIYVHQYCRRILAIYSPEQIIINETYPVKKYLNTNNEVVFFEGDRLRKVEENINKLEYFYKKLRHYFKGCHIIEMPKDAMACENHRWGLASNHYTDDFYIERLNQIIQIAEQKENEKMD
ncbi:MAG: DUF6270 domain-containing protein [bacterium]|nr:DUF6270 domain-containing protein [bacterium]